jgi:hypothetical protein
MTMDEVRMRAACAQSDESACRTCAWARTRDRIRHPPRFRRSCRVPTAARAHSGLGAIIRCSLSTCWHPATWILRGVGRPDCRCEQRRPHRCDARSPRRARARAERRCPTSPGTGRLPWAGPRRVCRSEHSRRPMIGDGDHGVPGVGPTPVTSARTGWRRGAAGGASRLERHRTTPTGCGSSWRLRAIPRPAGRAPLVART